MHSRESRSLSVNTPPHTHRHTHRHTQTHTETHTLFHSLLTRRKRMSIAASESILLPLPPPAYCRSSRARNQTITVTWRPMGWEPRRLQRHRPTHDLRPCVVTWCKLFAQAHYESKFYHMLVLKCCDSRIQLKLCDSSC